jgi:hypothetical protein
MHMTKDLIELLNQMQYPVEYNTLNPLCELARRGFDIPVGLNTEWVRYAGPEKAAEFLSQHSNIQAVADLEIGKVISTRYALSVDETEDGCNYPAFVSAILSAWVNKALPNEEIIAIMIDARAALDNFNASKGLHLVH